MVYNGGLTNINIEHIENQAKMLYKKLFVNYNLNEENDFIIRAVRKSFFEKIDQFQI